MGELLGGGSTSRLYTTLVIDQKIATSAGSWYQGGALDETSFGFFGAPTQTTSLEEVEAATDKVIAQLLENGVTEFEVEKTKNRLIKQAVFAQDSQLTLARIYGGSLVLGSTIEDIEAWPDRIKAVTTEAVDRAARKYLRKQRSVTGYLSPAKQEG